MNYKLMVIEMIEASVNRTGVRPVCIVLEDVVWLSLCTELHRASDPEARVYPYGQLEIDRVEIVRRSYYEREVWRR